MSLIDGRQVESQQPLRPWIEDHRICAASQGLGVALDSYTIAGRHVAEGKLRAIFGLDKAVRVKAHFAAYPARHAKRAPVEAFLSWLQGEASRMND